MFRKTVKPNTTTHKRVLSLNSPTKNKMQMALREILELESSLQSLLRKERSGRNFKPIAS